MHVLVIYQHQVSSSLATDTLVSGLAQLKVGLLAHAGLEKW